MKYFIILLIFIPTYAIAYTDIEILNQINEKIQTHGSSTQWIMGLVSLGLATCGGYFFKLINDNKQRIVFMENQLHKDFTKIRDQLNNQKLYVANNYTKDTKIESTIKREIDPVRSQLVYLQNAINLLVQNSTRHREGDE